jgi:hypothetical protein
MRKGWLFFLSLTLLMPRVLWADDQNCDCGLGRIAMYEFDVQVTRPTDPDAIQRYWALFRIARFARSKMTADRSCPSLVIIDVNVGPGGTLKSGIEQAVTAPPGPLDYDYVFTGQVTGSGGSYTAVGRIEAGETREVVREASFTFKDPGTGPENPGADAASSAIAAGLSPMAAVITQWEKKKRDGDPGIARSDPDGTLTLRPAKKRLNELETTDVEVEMVDCDGVPLKQRQIHFEPGTYEKLGSLEGTTNGKVDPPVVTTDDEGKAHVKYTASNQRGPAEIHAWYGNHRPKGTANAILGQTTVNVGAEQLAFRTVMDYKLHSDELDNHTETHHIETVYEAAGGSNCTTSMQANDFCKFKSSDLHASATSQWPQGSHSARLDNPGYRPYDDVRNQPAMHRNAQGATLQFFIFVYAMGDPGEDDNHFVGACNTPQWQPMQVDLTEEEFLHFSTLQKTLSIHAPANDSGCVGTGTLVLTGQK